MSRELDILAKEYSKTPATVMRKDLSLYRTSITTATSSFLRAVEVECKKQNQANLVLVAVIKEPEPKPIM